MNEPYLSPYRPYSRGRTRAALVIACASFCFSLWVSIEQSQPAGFFVRYGLVSLGIAIIVGIIMNLMPRKPRIRPWLWVLWGLAFAASCIGLFKAHR